MFINIGFFTSYLFKLIGGICFSLVILGNTTDVNAEPKPKKPQNVAAAQNHPDVIVDIASEKMIVELHGVVLREYVITFREDSLTISNLHKRLVRDHTKESTIQSAYLLSAAETITPAELEILTEESGLKAEKIQRYIPKEMVIITSDGLHMYIESDYPDAKPISSARFKHFFRRLWHTLTGGDTLYLQLAPNDAMSLLGVIKNHPHIVIK